MKCGCGANVVDPKSSSHKTSRAHKTWAKQQELRRDGFVPIPSGPQFLFASLPNVIRRLTFLGPVSAYTESWAPKKLVDVVKALIGAVGFENDEAREHYAKLAGQILPSVASGGGLTPEQEREIEIASAKATELAARIAARAVKREAKL